MPKKAPELPADMFTDDNSAISRLTGGAGRSEAARATPAAPPPTAPTQEPRKEVRNFKQTSIYLTQEEIVKLDDLAHAHFKRTGNRINRNDIIRLLVDRCQLSDIADLV